MSGTADPRLPAPDESAAAQSRRLSDILRARIAAAGGAIPFDSYMETALYEPGLGYYMTGTEKFGARGDFITAPELSNVFASCIARQCAPVLEYLGGGGIVEFGGGTGALARDVLTHLAGMDRLPAYYAIVEPSPDLRQRQRQLFASEDPQLRECVTWWTRLPDGPLRGVVLANELIDALPVKRFIMQGNAIAEVFVGLGDARLQAHAGTPTAALAGALPLLQSVTASGLPPGYQSEINLRMGPWLHSIADVFAQGMILLCDYGYPQFEYYNPQRGQGTLICHYRHRAHGDPFFWPGLQDISAAVDFTALAEAADAAGLTLGGYTTYAGFVLSASIDNDVRNSSDSRDRLERMSTMKTLILPGAMGETFKVMALNRDCPISLLCSDRFDQRHRLLPAIG